MVLFAVLSYGQAKPVEINQKQDRFNVIDVSFGYDVTIHESDSYSTTVTIDPSLAEFVNTSVKGGTLYVGMDEKAFTSDLKRLWNSRKYAAMVAKVDIYVPSYNGLYLSGRSVLVKNASIATTGKFSLVLEDNSSVSDMKVEAAAFDLQMCNKSSAKLSVKALDCKVENRNSAVLELDAAGDSLSIDLAGSTESDIVASFSTVKLKASGSAVLDVDGSAEKYLEVSGEGMSRINAEKMKVDSARVELSGSNRCRVDVKAVLQVNLSGSSHLYFGSDPVVRIDSITGSSMTRLEAEKE